MQLLHLALLLAGTAAYYDTVLEKKCMALKRQQENAGYVNGICFVALKDEAKEKYPDWMKLHDRCKLINGYRGHLAYIPSREFTSKLYKNGVIVAKGKYYIGARQFPVPPCEENGGMCKDEEQKKNWKFFDETGKEIGVVPNELWIDGEPGNQEPTESVAVLESFDTYKGGLNDMNADNAGYKPLCQFIDYLQCSDGYILIRDKCYKIHADPVNAADAKRQCDKDGATLASIHDDAMNAIIIDFSRDNTTVSKKIEKPIRFGLQYGSEWTNDDGTPVDFFRWWDQMGCGVSGNVRAGLVVSGFAQNPDPSYWTILKDNEETPFLCQKNPTKAYDSA